MPSSKKKKPLLSQTKVQKETISLFYIVAITLLLLLSLVNIQNYTSIPKVLGITSEYDTTEVIKSKKYWEDIVSKNPTYYDGWNELYKINLILGNNLEADNAQSIAKRIDFNR